MQALLNPWEKFFAKHNIICDLSEVEVPERKEDQDFLVVWPKEVSMAQMVDIFRKMLDEKSRMVLYWQGVRSLLDPNGTWKEIPTPPMVHERGTESGSYVTWMKACVQKGEDRLVSRKAWDTTLTLPEAVLYNIYMMDLYGQDFVDSVFSFQRCFGSKRSASGGSVGIEWDLQDIKVCLRVSG